MDLVDSKPNRLPKGGSPTTKGKAFSQKLREICNFKSATAQPDHRNRVKIGGLGISGKAFTLSSLCAEFRTSALLITPHQDQSELLASDLEFFHHLQALDIPTYLLPPLETPTAWSAALQRELVGQRMKALFSVHQAKQGILVAPLPTLLRPIPPPSWLAQCAIRLRLGDTLPLEDIIGRLVSLGYHRGETAERPGEFACRGGIMDVYGSSMDQPVRLELSGDSLESLREYDSITQKSTASIEEALILPACEGHEQEEPGGSGDSLRELLSYFSKDVLLFLDEPEKIRDELREEKEGSEDPQVASRSQALALSLFSANPVAGSRGSGVGVVELRSLDLKEAPGEEVANLGYQSPPALGIGHTTAPFSKTFEALNELRKRFHIFVVCRNQEQRLRLQEILLEHEVPAAPAGFLTSPDARPAPLQLVVGHLSSGFFLHEIGLGLITEEEIFGKTPMRPFRRPKGRPSLSSFEDLKASDYVVHLHYGIGRFLGLQRLLIDGFDSDYMTIAYADGGKVYVPLENLDLVQKYIGAEGSAPRLDRLGTPTWSRTQQRVKKEIRKMAYDLLDLYASREVAQGQSFSKDSLLSKEFEAAFEYDETPDQYQAIDEVKADLESPRPMDRVVCGDVGYGKTEVAMRAAFKVAMDNRQVAILVPTTILAEQHYQTFNHRFSAFPLRVEVLSRFRSPREQKAVVRDLADGKVDVIIGTHRLIQKDVSFRDLGLVIIDEEQRFGVAHKERFKQLRKTVDVLTLTATPIPRTLQMALAGVRDLSTIDTAPPDRLAVKTIVASFDKRLIREAVIRERQRGGQIFFVHNRIKGIERVAHLLKELTPDVKIGIAHGQMREADLERVMRKFLDKEYDLLLTTAIIESGMDIPNANTIIINRADQFGLADLYQLRGRVGRSKYQAYAYLLVPDSGGLTEEARKRLMALQEFSELGSGFKIAARDLEIRGAGSLLGREQSGHIAAVGFELYLQMIKDAVQELKGQPLEVEIKPSFSLPVSAYLPEDYISDTYSRLMIYKRLASLLALGDLSSLKTELLDRFGPLPEPVQRLLEVIELKILARSTKITSVDSKPEALLIGFHPSAVLPERGLKDLLDEYQDRLRFTSEFSLRITLSQEGWDQVFETTREILLKLSPRGEGQES